MVYTVGLHSVETRNISDFTQHKTAATDTDKKSTLINKILDYFVYQDGRQLNLLSTLKFRS